MTALASVSILSDIYTSFLNLTWLMPSWWLFDMFSIYTAILSPCKLKVLSSFVLRLLLDKSSCHYRTIQLVTGKQEILYPWSLVTKAYSHFLLLKTASQIQFHLNEAACIEIHGVVELLVESYLFNILVSMSSKFVSGHQSLLYCFCVSSMNTSSCFGVSGGARLRKTNCSLLSVRKRF